MEFLLKEVMTNGDIFDENPELPGVGPKIEGSPKGSGARGGDKSPKTPVGRRGRGDKVKPGANKESVVNGRKYYGHALDQMQARGYTPRVVENTIRNGIPKKANRPDRIRFYDKENNISVIVERQTGTVVTVRGGN